MKSTYDFSEATRGAIAPQQGKTRITMMLDDDVLQAFRDQAANQGKGYQTLINETLRAALIPENRQITEDSLRTILREVITEHR